MTTTCIQRCTLVLRVHGQKNQEKHIFRLKNYLHKIIFPHIEEYFSQNVKNIGEQLQIHRLVLNLGALHDNDAQEQLKQRIMEQLRQQLAFCVRASPPFDEDQATLNVVPVRLLEYLLQHGARPWWSSRNPPQSLSSLYADCLRDHRAASIEMIRRHWHSPIFRTRLATAITTSAEALLVLFIPAITQTQIIAVQQDLVRARLWLNKASQMVAALRTSGWRTEQLITDCTLAYLYTQRDATPFVWHADRWCDLFCDVLIQHTPLRVHTLRTMVSESGEALESEFTNALLATLDRRVVSPHLRSNAHAATSLHRASPTTHHADSDITNPHAHEDFPADPRRVSETLADTDLCYVANAGLVLIAAFLPRLFVNLRWINDDQRWCEGKQTMALYLLHYLAGGEPPAEESQLMLNKLLIGYDADAPVAPSIELSGADRVEGDALLQAVIDHWQALKNTSIDGLRRAFLQREGRLQRQSDHWLLRLEQQSYDMLLDRLPWNYRVIKLPWMASTLIVE